MKYLKYEDIALTPNLGVLDSRSKADVSLKFFHKTFKLPIVPANMKAVINESLSKWLSENDYFYIMHRFGLDIFNFVKVANQENWNTISISVGIKDQDKKLIKDIKESSLRVDFITIDIAHGHSFGMRDMISFIKQHLKCVVIAGNVASYYSISDLVDWGADCIKIGVGQGAPCSTKDKTGFTAPMFTCVKECSKFNFSDVFDKVPLIADGGIKCNGDIAKSIVAGATMAMAGSLFSRCTDSPADNIEVNGVFYKKYFGSASALNKGHNNYIEGFEKRLESNDMSYREKMIEIEQDLQSSISYAGGRFLNCLEKVSYIEV